MVFHPSLEQESPDGFYALVEGLLDEIFHFASLVPRVAKHNELPDYQADVEEVCLYSLVRPQLKYHLLYLRLIPVCSLADLSGVARHVPWQLEAVSHLCRYACELSALTVLLLIANQVLNGLEIERCSITMSMYIHRIMSLVCRESMPQTPLNASALRTEFRTNVVCRYCALALAMSGYATS